MSSLRNARPRWVSTVFSVTNSVWAISRLVPPVGRELDHAPLAGSQRVRAGVLGGAGPNADRRELGPRPALQGSGAAAGGQRERLEQRLPGGGALSGGAERCAEVEQHTRVLQPRRRGGQYGERCREPAPAALTGGPTSAWARSAMPIARGAPNDWARRTSSAARLRASLVAAELGQREGRRRAPREHGRVLSAERRVVERAAAQLLDRGLVVAGRGVEARPRRSAAGSST